MCELKEKLQIFRKHRKCSLSNKFPIKLFNNNREVFEICHRAMVVTELWSHLITLAYINTSICAHIVPLHIIYIHICIQIYV